MTRPATLADIPRLVADAEAFFAPSGIPGGFDPDYFAGWLEEWIPQEGFWCGMTETGSVAVIFHPFFASGKTFAQEFWVYDGGGNGRGLIDAMEAEAQRRGALFLGVSTQLDQRGETLARWYERRGYTRREIALAREF